jgi:hypothetical protein
MAAKRKLNACCSFCRKSYRDVGPLVEGPGDVYICGECIELCQAIIDQEKKRQGVGQDTAKVPTLNLGGQEYRIETREDFFSFVLALVANLVEHPDEWEHRDLANFLKALGFWVNDMGGYYQSKGEPVPDPPTWKSLAEMFMAARVYE